MAMIRGLFLLSEYVTSVLFLLMYKNTNRDVTITANKTPPTAPSIIVLRL